MSDRRSLILSPARPGAETAKQWRQYRYNPIASATPASLTRALDEFESGWIRSAALLWEAICDRDDMARPCSIKRVGAVSTRPFGIVRSEESPEAERHEAALQYFFDNLTVTNALDLNVRGTFSDLTEQMMSAQLHQYAAHEILWQPGARDEEGRPAMTAELRFVPLYLFENTSGRLRYTGPQLSGEGRDLEDGGWMTTVGDGIMKAVSVAWMFKRLSLSDWLQYSEKFGIPGIHGTTPAQKGTAEFAAFVDALEAFASDWVMASAQGSEVKLIEVGKTGDAPFSPMVERMDRQIAILMLGSDLATLSRDNGTGASLQGEEASALFARDCKKISSTLQTQLSRPVIEYLFGPGVRPLAYIEIAPPQQQDIDQDIKIDEHLAKNGIDQDPAEMAARYGRSLPEGFGEEEGNEATRQRGIKLEDEDANEEDGGTEDLENAFNPSQPRGKNGRWVKLGAGDVVIRAGQKDKLAAAGKLAAELRTPKPGAPVTSREATPAEVEAAWKMIREDHESGQQPVKAFGVARQQVEMAAGADIDRETWSLISRRLAEENIADPKHALDDVYLDWKTMDEAWEMIRKEHAQGRPLAAYDLARAEVMRARKKELDDQAWQKVRKEHDEFYRRELGAWKPRPFPGKLAATPWHPQRRLSNAFNPGQRRDLMGRWVDDAETLGGSPGKREASRSWHAEHEKLSAQMEQQIRTLAETRRAARAADEELAKWVAAEDALDDADLDDPAGWPDGPEKQRMQQLEDLEDFNAAAEAEYDALMFKMKAEHAADAKTLAAKKNEASKASDAAWKKWSDAQDEVNETQSRLDDIAGGNNEQYTAEQDPFSNEASGLRPPASGLRAAIAQDLQPAYDAIATALQAADSDILGALEKLNADWDAITDRVLDGTAADQAMESVLSAAFLAGLGLDAGDLVEMGLSNDGNTEGARKGWETRRHGRTREIHGKPQHDMFGVRLSEGMTEEQNFERGTKALGWALRNKSGVRGAMRRPELGPIDFPWGTPGDASNEYKGGSGLSHIIAKHGEADAHRLPEAIAKGELLPHTTDPAKRIIIHGRYQAYLALNKDKTRHWWALTAFTPRT